MQDFVHQPFRHSEKGMSQLDVFWYIVGRKVNRLISIYVYVHICTYMYLFVF